MVSAVPNDISFENDTIYAQKDTIIVISNVYRDKKLWGQITSWEKDGSYRKGPIGGKKVLK